MINQVIYVFIYVVPLSHTITIQANLNKQLVKQIGQNTSESIFQDLPQHQKSFHQFLNRDFFLQKLLMGNNNSLSGTCSPQSSSFEPNNTQTLFPTHLNDKKMLSLSSIRLTSFRNSLQKPQCFYVFSTLLQQYYSLFVQNGKVVVSDSLCYVTKLGEVKVDLWIDAPETPLGLNNQVTHSFVTMVSQILEAVGCLSLEKYWLAGSEYAYFQDKLTNLIYKHHNSHDRLYHELLHEVNLFMESSRINCNLIGALLRLKESNQGIPHLVSRTHIKSSQCHGETPYLGISRSHSTSELHSQLEYRGISKYSMTDQEPSTIHKIKDNSTKIDSRDEENQFSGFRRPRKSTYRHKMVRTEGQSFFTHLHSDQNLLKNRETFLSEAPPTTERPASKEQSHTIPENHISAQYSINIFTAFAKKKGSKGSPADSKCSQKVKFHPHCSKSNSSKQNGSQQGEWKNKTSLHDLASRKSRTQKNSRVYTKSVLDELARSVQVVDQPSSKSLIF